MFALCPSGSGPNSIRLWEALGYGSIPVILADHLWLPGDAELWQQAALFVPEREAAVAVLPAQIEALAADPSRLQAMQAAGQQLLQRYGLPGFVPDVRAFLRNPMAVLSARARQQLPSDPLEMAASSPAELPLRASAPEPPECRALPFCAALHPRRRSCRTPADPLAGGLTDLCVIAEWPPVAGGELVAAAGARGGVMMGGARRRRLGGCAGPRGTTDATPLVWAYCEVIALGLCCGRSLSVVPAAGGWAVKTDHWFYGLFQSAPDLITLLLPAAGGVSEAPSLAADGSGDALYRFDAPEP